MIVVLLAAGYGTRLYPLTKEIPKALLPIKGKPIVEYLIEKVERLSEPPRQMVIVSNHPYADTFKRWLTESRQKLPWIVLDDGSTSDQNRLGSVGDLAFAIRTCSIDEDLLVLGSDNLLKDDFNGFLDFARARDPSICLGAYTLPDLSLASRYGVLTVEPNGRILTLEEKPQRPASALISTAIYFFPRRKLAAVLEYVGLSPSTDTLGSFIHWLIRRGEIFAYRFRGPWFDIGDLHSYTQAEEQFSL